MGRRGLSRAVKRTPTPPEALRHFVRFWLYEEEISSSGQALPPIDAVHFFGRPGPMGLEIGCGTGEFLVALAEANPDKFYLGVDISTQSVNFAARLAHEAKLDNIRFIRSPMNALYMHLVPGALSEGWMHFPDPYVRTRGIHKMFNAEFLQQLALAMKSGGIFSFVSDHEALFCECLELSESFGEPWTKNHQERFLRGYRPLLKSRYQLKWERYGVTPWRFELRRN